MLKRVVNLSKMGFRFYVELIKFNLDDYNTKNQTDYLDIIEMLKSDLTLNYIVIS